MNSFDPSIYITEFITEFEEQLHIMDKEVLRLEQNSEDPLTIQAIFRAAHTLKGSAAAMGFEPVKQVVHCLENIFDMLRRKEMKCSTLLIDAIFQSIDALKQMKESIINGTLDETDSTHLIRRLERFALPESEHAQNLSAAAPLERIFNPLQRSILLQAIAMGQNVYSLQIRLAEGSLMKAARSLLIYHCLENFGEIVCTHPPLEQIESEFSGEIEYILASQRSEQEIMLEVNRISEIDSVQCHAIGEEQIELISESFSYEAEATVPEMPLHSMAASGKTEAKVTINQTVRVDVKRLEQLMNLVGELVISQTRLQEVQYILNEHFTNSEEIELLGEVTGQLNRIVHELQEGMMKARMFPVEQLFNRFPRIVRDLSHQVNKEIELIIEGKETELERTLIEEISDPIIHLLRNAIDHGIELPEVRKKKGKTNKGTLLLKAAHEENQVIITIADDGQGIDPNKIKEAAIKKGLITPSEAEKMSVKESILLIFEPGFSTASKITDLSGRGVGMDIVRSRIEKLGGVIEAESSPQGTIFTIKIPLTLAIIRALFVKLGDRTFALPLANVMEIVQIHKDARRVVNDREVVVIRDHIYPLVKLHNRLNIPCSNKHAERFTIVVLSQAKKTLALVVDQTIGNREIVIKPLGSVLDNPHLISGATITGDGTVALILDANVLVKEEGVLLESTQSERSQHTSDGSEYITFMLDSAEYGIGIHCVKDIIAVPHITPVTASARSVIGLIDLRGKMIPVIDLRNKLFGAEYQMTSRSRILIVEMGQNLVGLLVDDVTQIMKISKQDIDISDIQNNRLDSRFVQGIYCENQRFVILLDTPLLFASDAFTEWTTATPTDQSHTSRR